jgi:NADH-quinone oxidoreductase subunit J
MGEAVIFYVFGAAALAGAFGMVLARNPVHGALSLVGTMFSIAALFVAQQAWFLAAAQVIVYAGAIMILFLFVIMLIGVDSAQDMSERLPFQRSLATLLTLGLIAELSWLTRQDWVPAVATPAGQGADAAIEAGGNVGAIAETLFSRYLYPFEVTSILLVIAAVAAVVLAKQQEPTAIRRVR